MTLSTENILLVGSILLFIALVVGKTSHRLGVPVLILFLGVGMLAGSDGIGGIHFDNPKTAQFIGIVALNCILFSGGLDTSWSSVKPILGQGISLSTLGVLITAITVGIFVWAITDFTLYEGLLLGSIVSSTDSAAVFSILRSKSIALKENIRPTLELESGSNDPMAYILTIIFTGMVVNQDSSLLSMVPLFFRQLILGIIFGFALGKLAEIVINKIELEYEGLYVVLVMAIVFFIFSATDFLGGNGFLAVYIAAVFLGNKQLMHKKKILKSFDSYAWLMQIILFLTLGLLVFPKEILPLAGLGMLISLFLILIARPIAVHLSLLPFNLTSGTRTFISWVGLRGAVPIVFATYPMIAGAEKSDIIFNLVFFISITSVLIQGTTLLPIARYLNLIVPDVLKPNNPLDIDSTKIQHKNLTQWFVPDNCPALGKPLFQIELPKNLEISIIKRDNTFLVPNGATVLMEDDILYLLTEDQESLLKFFECMERTEEESLG